MPNKKTPEKSSRVNPSVHESIAPLSKGFFLTSIFGFLIAVMFITQFSLAWGTIIAIICGVMFLASVISITKAPIEEELTLDDRDAGRDKRVVVMSKKEYDDLRQERSEKKKGSSEARKSTVSKGGSAAKKASVTKARSSANQKRTKTKRKK